MIIHLKKKQGPYTPSRPFDWIIWIFFILQMAVLLGAILVTCTTKLFKIQILNVNIIMVVHYCLYMQHKLCQHAKLLHVC